MHKWYEEGINWYRGRITGEVYKGGYKGGINGDLKRYTYAKS